MQNTEYPKDERVYLNNLPFFPSDGPRRPESTPKKEFYHPEGKQQLPLRNYIPRRQRIRNTPQNIPQQPKKGSS